MSSVSKAIIAKKVNGEDVFIYPRTASDVVEYTSNKSVKQKLQELDNLVNNNTELDNRLSDIESRLSVLEPSMIPVSSMSDMVDTDAVYILTTNNQYYYYNDTNSQWVPGGSIAGLNIDTTLTVQGSAADAKAVGDKIFKIQIVEELPATGVANTFYLIAKDSGGYDKYWYITDNNTGTSKWDRFGETTTLVVTSLPPVGDSGIDYILKSSAGCLFYKWVNNGWGIVAGSIASVVNELPGSGNTFTDYYVPDSDGVYMHYRWNNGAYHLVGSDSYNQTEIDEMLADINDTTTSIQTTLDGKIDGAYVEDNCLYLTSNGIIIAGPLGPFSGGNGSGGSVNSATLTVTNTTSWGNTTTIAEGSNCNVTITWSSIEDELPTGNGTAKIIEINGSARTVKSTQSISQGNIAINLAPYCTNTENKIAVSVSDIYDNTRTIIFNISRVTLNLSSSFDASTIYTGTIPFRYTAVGALSKTMHFLVDDEEVGTEVVTTSGSEKTFVIPQITAEITEKSIHGGHTIDAYFVCTINGQSVQSNIIHYEIIYAEEGNETPIIVSDFNTTTVDQYTTLNINYLVYNAVYSTSTVNITINGVQQPELVVDRTRQVLTYRADTSGRLTIVISSGSVSKTITVNVEATEADIAAEENQLDLYLAAAGRSNNEAVATRNTWTYNDINAELTGFNYSSNGWINDDDGVTALRVSGGAKVTIPYKLFANDFYRTGKTIELDFATREVLNYDATIISCMNMITVTDQETGEESEVEETGFMLTAQLARFKSIQSEISMQYKEDEHVRISFVIQKGGADSTRFMSVYVNGVISGVIQYPEGDIFIQSTPKDIVIGSDECTVDLYCIRVYDTDLSRTQVLNNWIADTQDVTTMLERYNRNNVYNELGNIVISKLPASLPYMIIECAELPQYKGDKKTVNITYVDPLNSNRNFTATGAQANVQGTSSQYYPRKNYKISFKTGFDLKDGTHLTKYPLRGNPKAETPEAIPTNAFCFKADVASSEGANNVELVRLYNDICPYQTPPQLEDSRIRQGIDGYPIVIFWNDGTDITFIGKYNFNNDKGTEEVFGFAEGDESWEIKNNNSARTIFKQSEYVSTHTTNDGKVVADWLDDFEARFPEDNEDYTNLKTLTDWIVSTDQTAATNNALSESYTGVDGTVYTSDTAAYRLAKFKKELENYMEKDAVIFYYLFTELFLMVDSRAKNAFPSFFGSDKWFSLPYDFDTALGIDNNGNLVFPYNLEDDAQYEGTDVFNGQQSVLWINLREAFKADIMNMYKTLRSSTSLSYNTVNQMFEEHQNKWGEAIFNEDAYFKYIDPLINGAKNSDGNIVKTDAYLPMLQGSKASQRRWWLYNRFKYIDSKYNAGSALDDHITFRANAPAEGITVTPYADVYVCAQYGNTSASVPVYVTRNTEYLIPCTLTGTVTNLETHIYSASQLSSIGDLSGFIPNEVDISRAIKLQSLKLGDGDSNYVNEKLNSVAFGNNTLLKSIDVRNCINLSTTLQASNCTNIETILAEGSSITGVSLPVGGNLKVLHLPATITSLIIRNQSAITDFTVAGFSNVLALRLENVSTVIDSLAIVNAIMPTARIRIIGFSWSVANKAAINTLYNRLSAMGGLDIDGAPVGTAQLAGTIHVESLPSEADLNALNNQFHTTFGNDINITTDEANYTTVMAKLLTDDGDVLITKNNEAILGKVPSGYIN